MDSSQSAMSKSANEVVAGLDATMFGEGVNVCFVCTEQVDTPQNLASQWFTFRADDDAESQLWDLDAMTVMVILTDVLSKEQRRAVGRIGQHLRDMGNPPPSFLLPISPATAEARQQAEVLFKDFHLDDILWAPGNGYAFALAIQAKLAGLTTKLDRYERDVTLRCNAKGRQSKMRSSIHQMRWQYLPCRMFQAIPPLRHGVRDHKRGVANLQFSRRIMRSAFGIVCAVEPNTTAVAVDARAAAAGTAPSSMLVIDKSHMVQLSNLRMLNCSLGAMAALRDVRHPNLPRFLDAFQTQRRLYVHLELSGECTLFSRLKLRDIPARTADRQPLSTQALRSVIMQIGGAVTHLHKVVQIAHRDIRPENVVIEEQVSSPPDGSVVNLKLGGFELATTEQQSRLPCGTLPFVAPEVLRAGQDYTCYDCMAVDIWGLGVLFMELACGLKSVNDALPDVIRASSSHSNNILNDACLQAPPANFADRIAETFTRPCFLKDFFQSVVPEALELRGWLESLVEKMIKVAPEGRLTADDLDAALLSC